MNKITLPIGMRLGIGSPALQGLMEVLQLFLQFLSD